MTDPIRQHKLRTGCYTDDRPAHYRGERRAPTTLPAMPSWVAPVLVMAAVWLAVAAVIAAVVPDAPSQAARDYGAPTPTLTPAPDPERPAAVESAGQTHRRSDTAATRLPAVLPAPAAETTDGPPPAPAPSVLIGTDEPPADADPPASAPPPPPPSDDPGDSGGCGTPKDGRTP